MAFVFETERAQLYPKKDRSSQNLGPGQYLPLTEFKFVNPEQVPFGVSTNRIFPKKPLPTPGPGSYYHDIDKENHEKLLKNSVKNFITKEEEIKINKLAKYEPEKGRQERALKRYRENFELLGFNSKAKRFENKNRVTTPGPGAYSDKRNYNLAKLSEQKCLEKKEIIFKTNNDRNKVFNVDKEQVYYLNYNKNINNKDKNNINININNNSNKKNKNNTKSNINTKKEIKKKLEIEQKKYKKEVKYRVSSIPSKNNKGYIVEPDTGKLARKTNPEFYKIFTGDKDDAVGPGSYELLFPEDWKKTGTSWSKYKWEKEPKKIRPKSSYNVNSINCQIGNYRETNKLNNVNDKSSESTKINSELSSYYKSYTTKQLNYKDPTAHNIDTITEFIKKKKMPAFIPINSNPGPGFYYDEDMMSGLRKAMSPPLVKKEPYNPDTEILNEIFNSNKYDKQKKIILDFKKEQADNFKKKMLDKLKQTKVPFLSKAERFNLEPYKKTKSSVNKKKINKKTNQDLMKGTKIQNNYYDNDSIIISKYGNKFRISESGNISHEISNYSSTNNSSVNNMNNINNIFYNRPQSMSGVFYRKDIRFRERVMEENSKKWVPGPGSYINPFTGKGKSNSIKMNGRYMDIRSCKRYLENSRPKTALYSSENNNNYFQINNNPPVGYYESDKMFTLKQNVINKLKQGNRTFNSTLISDRNAIYQFQKNAPNGPGTYFIEEKNFIPQNYIGFNMSSLRFGKGGKNNTKDAVEKICDNKIELNAVIGGMETEEENKIDMAIIQKGFNGSKYKNKKRKKSDIGPGTYEYGEKIYPWVKPSFNSKYL